MDRKQVLETIKNNDRIPSLPQTLSEVLSVLDKDTSTANNIASIIKQDVSLTAKILRIANSAFYKKRNQVSTVSSAVMLLGTRAVQALALSVSVYEFFKTDSSDKLNIKQFWRHSLEVALISRVLAGKLGYRVKEEAFVAGLLHDLGILLLNGSFPEEYSKVLDKSKNGKPIHECEIEVFDCTHADVMGYLGKRWNLPEQIYSALAAHHSPVKNSTTEAGHLIPIVRAAEYLSKYAFDYQLSQTGNKNADSRKAIASLGVSEAELQLLINPLMDDVIRTAQFLDIDIGTPLELVTLANEMLHKLFISIDALLREQVQLQQRLVNEEKRKSALKSLRIILATFSHYINNATASILGRAQLLGLSLAKGEISDNDRIIANTVDVIQKSVENISVVLEELKVLDDFDTVPYYENTSIINIEHKVRRRLQELEMNK